ncbi:MAG TPA: ankyrin repeat domain-containing protein [Planctomycetota bacterium]|nr:ankyrin repeat domain-containing protein [Planctomycetota bacterium]
MLRHRFFFPAVLLGLLLFLLLPGKLIVAPGCTVAVVDEFGSPLNGVTIIRSWSDGITHNDNNSDQLTTEGNRVTFPERSIMTGRMKSFFHYLSGRYVTVGAKKDGYKLQESAMFTPSSAAANELVVKMRVFDLFRDIAENDYYFVSRAVQQNPEYAKLVDADGNTLLHALARKGNYSTWPATALLEAKANVDALNANGETPLHLAIRSEDVELVKLLLKEGASRTISDNLGNTPLSLAAKAVNPAIQTALAPTGSPAP